MEIKIIDNFLSNAYFLRIKEIIDSEDFSWNFSDNITTDILEKKYNNCSYGFSHQICLGNSFYENKDNLHFILYGFFGKIIDLTGKNNIARCRVDMTTYCGSKNRHKVHVDLPYPNITTIFYITDNVDSETIIYNKKTYNEEEYDYINENNIELEVLKKIEPKRNRIVIFDGAYLHTGHSPLYENKRVLINTNIN